MNEYTDKGHRELSADDPDAYTAMIDHVPACLGQAVNQLAPASVLDSLRLTLGRPPGRQPMTKLAASATGRT